MFWEQHLSSPPFKDEALEQLFVCSEPETYVVEEFINNTEVWRWSGVNVPGMAVGATMLFDTQPGNYAEGPQHSDDKVYILPCMVAQAKYTKGAVTETEPENDTFAGILSGDLCQHVASCCN